jgi:hypothetical protein
MRNGSELLTCGHCVGTTSTALIGAWAQPNTIDPNMLDSFVSPYIDADQRRWFDPGELFAGFERKAIFLLAQESEVDITSLRRAS